MRPQCVSSASSPMRTPWGYWLACRPTVRRSAQLVTRSWSATGNDELVPKDGHQFWGGVRRLWRPARASLGVLKTGRCGAVGTSKKYLERLSVCSIESLTWQEHVSPLDCQGFKAPLSPRRGFTFGVASTSAGSLFACPAAEPQVTDEAEPDGAERENGV